MASKLKPWGDERLDRLAKAAAHRHQFRACGYVGDLWEGMLTLACSCGEKKDVEHMHTMTRWQVSSEKKVGSFLEIVVSRHCYHGCGLVETVTGTSTRKFGFEEATEDENRS